MCIRDSSSSEPESPEPEDTTTWGEPLPKNATPVGEKWFDDAIFIGDSLTEGLSAYNPVSYTHLGQKADKLSHKGYNHKHMVEP